MSWTPSEALPNGVAGKLLDAMADAEASLMVATEAQAASQIDQLFAQLPMPGEIAMRQWRKIFRSYPYDLVRLGVAEVIKAHRWETPPKLAQFCLVVDDEIKKRNDWRRKLSIAMLKAKMTQGPHRSGPGGWSPLSDETKAALEKLKADLADTNRMPLHPQDQQSDGFKDEQREESLERVGHETREFSHG